MRIWGTFLPSCQYWLIPRLTNIEINNYSCKNVIIWWQKFLMWNFLFVKSTVKVQPGSVFCERAWLKLSHYLIKIRNTHSILKLKFIYFVNLSIFRSFRAAEKLKTHFMKCLNLFKKFSKNKIFLYFLCLTPTLSESWFIKNYKIFGSRKFKRRVHRITKYGVFSIKILSSLIG